MKTLILGDFAFVLLSFLSTAIFAAGDYIISVTECQKADHWKGIFKLRVTVR